MNNLIFDVMHLILMAPNFDGKIGTKNVVYACVMNNLIFDEIIVVILKAQSEQNFG